MKNKLKPIRSVIELWNILLPELHGELDACTDLLTADEQERAGRFVKREDAERFILCRGLRRRILADYLEQAPSGLRFEENDSGKPFVAGSELNFNVSHSRDRLLIAVTAGRAVGVDIEFRRSNVAMCAIAERWFAPQERDFFKTSENPQKAFFDIWAKKEAYVKALGQGIFHELSSFCVPLDLAPDLPTTCDAGCVIGKNRVWFFQPLEIDPDYAAALVSEAPPVPVQLRKFTPHG